MALVAAQIGQDAQKDSNVGAVGVKHSVMLLDRRPRVDAEIIGPPRVILRLPATKNRGNKIMGRNPQTPIFQSGKVEVRRIAETVPMVEDTAGPGSSEHHGLWSCLEP
jgi:hypothetical protein